MPSAVTRPRFLSGLLFRRTSALREGDRSAPGGRQGYCRATDPLKLSLAALPETRLLPKLSSELAPSKYRPCTVLPDTVVALTVIDPPLIEPMPYALPDDTQSSRASLAPAPTVENATFPW